MKQGSADLRIGGPRLYPRHGFYAVGFYRTAKERDEIFFKKIIAKISELYENSEILFAYIKQSRQKFWLSNSDVITRKVIYDV